MPPLACRYAEEANSKIEQAHKQGDASTTIRLGARELDILFGLDYSCFATQRDGCSTRRVRRVIKIPSEFGKMMRRTNLAPERNYTMENVVDGIVNGIEKLHFGNLLCCPITKENMTDPVMTDDGYTYERSAIEQWYDIYDIYDITAPLGPLSCSEHRNLLFAALVTGFVPQKLRQ